MTDFIKLYRKAENYFFRSISSKYIDLGDGANAYMTGDAGLNFIYITQYSNAWNRILIQGNEFFSQNNFSFEVIIPQELITPQVADVLNSMGYILQSTSVAMIASLGEMSFSQIVNFGDSTVIKANDNQLNEWMIPLIGAFQSNSKTVSIYAANHANALKQNINLLHFSLYEQQKPISSITLSMYDNTIARIDDVGTLPDFQGKGYATALMRYVLSEAKRLGAHYCFLESSDSGLGVYQKLGFKPLFKNNVYAKHDQFRH